MTFIVIFVTVRQSFSHLQLSVPRWKLW